MWHGKNGPNRTYDALPVTFDQIAKSLANLLNRPVVDRTGIAGMFDLHLEYASDGNTPLFPPPGVDEPTPTAPSIFTAVREQLGLRLDAIRGPWEVLVIDSVDRPTPN